MAQRPRPQSRGCGVAADIAGPVAPGFATPGLCAAVGWHRWAAAVSRTWMFTSLHVFIPNWPHRWAALELTHRCCGGGWPRGCGRRCRSGWVDRWHLRRCRRCRQSDMGAVNHAKVKRWANVLAPDASVVRAACAHSCSGHAIRCHDPTSTERATQPHTKRQRHPQEPAACMRAPIPPIHLKSETPRYQHWGVRKVFAMDFVNLELIDAGEIVSKTTQVNMTNLHAYNVSATHGWT